MTGTNSPLQKKNILFLEMLLGIEQPIQNESSSALSTSKFSKDHLQRENRLKRLKKKKKEEEGEKEKVDTWKGTVNERKSSFSRTVDYNKAK